jgi:predicted nucleotidyltransferase
MERLLVNKLVQEMIQEFSKLEEVEGIMLAGSMAANTNDEHSDYDIYIYASKEIPVESRKLITDKYCSFMGLNNQYWETEDDGFMKEGNIPVELIYRDLNWIEGVLNSLLMDFRGSIGYSTCFWANFMSSIILYDKEGKLASLQEKYRILYPVQLKKDIIKKNYPLLKQEMFSYYHQIEKALLRQDLISVNHRIAALFASYFDIIFAYNEMAHPGEKKLLRIIKENNLKVPENMEENINNILKYSGCCSENLLPEIDRLVVELDCLLHS